MGLITAKQAAFAVEYVKDRNATQAAIRAGYSPKSARVTACKLLTKANIRRSLGALERKAAAFAEKTADDVREKLAEVAWSESPDLAMRDRLKALELYARHIGMERQAKADNVPVFNVQVILEGERK